MTSSSFTGGGKTYHNVSFTSLSSMSGGGNIIKGQNTFNNLTIAGLSGGGIGGIGRGRRKQGDSPRKPM
jgi:hypothetical protein